MNSWQKILQHMERRVNPHSFATWFQPTQQDGAANEVDPADLVLAVRADVVGDDEASVGPGDQDRAVKPGLLDDRRDVVRPALLVEVVLGRQRPLGHPVAAVVERHDAERL